MLSTQDFSSIQNKLSEIQNIISAGNFSQVDVQLQNSEQKVWSRNEVKEEIKSILYEAPQTEQH
jgi:hypothetical protein